MLPSQTMTERKSDLDKAAKKASSGLMEALCFVEKFIDISSSEERQPISNRIETLFPGRIRSQDIYSKLMWFTTQVIMLHVYPTLGSSSSKGVKFNPGLCQISSKVFLSKNMQLELTKHCSTFTPRYSNDDTYIVLM